MADKPWTIEEVAIIAADYRHMLIQELNGQSYNKAAHNRLLQKQTGRSHGSIEFKHRNISAVLRDANCVYLDGYKPADNYQQLLAHEVHQHMLDDPIFDNAVLQAVQKTWLPQLDIDYTKFKVDAPRGSAVADQQPAYGVHPVKRDYLAREARNRSLGEAGETVVTTYERLRLRQLGHDKLAERVEHVAKERGDGLGFDVLSFETDGRERFIEVKSTAFGMELPFYVSRGELEFSSDHQDQYHLYRVFGMQKAPRMFTVCGDMQKMLWLDPTSYRAGVLL